MLGLRMRYLGPVTLISLCLMTLCAFTAISLFTQQATITRVLRENVESQRVAIELEQCLQDLIVLEDDRVETVRSLHDRVRGLLASLLLAADQPEEMELYTQIVSSYEKYLEQWRGLPPPIDAGHEEARRLATRRLETDVLKRCEEFEHYNSGRVEQSAEHHERVLRQLAWGMGGVGGLGGVAGLILGFGVARSLSRSIRRLQIQLQDAAGKLGPDLPEIVLTEEGDFQHLHAEVDRLSERIEQVVRDLQQREHEILRAEQLAAVGQLAAGVAHEIRNPLTSIKMLVQASLEDDESMSREDFRVVEAEVRRMERSLQTFLDFARPPKPQRKTIALQPLIEDVFELVRPRAEKQKIRLEKALENPTLVGDAEQLRQVLVNLFLNALDAMPNGGTLKVSVQSNLPHVEIEVADTGPGIPKAIFPRLFEPFASTKDTGLGLGLVISKRIIEDHGGVVNAANRQGGGASIFIRLPGVVNGQHSSR
ncbi:sensor histidine kinase [Limnoglobus roseus]|uniref:histidine kinase n=1 Tax=Limnoglobus roseus TaxID=2598579 RepID=A0A5C1AHH3_9BACT|nr:ATP-binding protein [Limnoglobus roseus]QEL18085.1 HAMP domain-containing protein [Limnoglobus roseus]